MALVLATNINRGFKWIFVIEKGKTNSASGPSFCHVQRTRQFIHLIDDIVDGNQ